MMSNTGVGRAISFKEFLASQEDRLRAEQAAQARAKETWVTAVVGLIDSYVTARLDIWVGTQKISIRPVAINVLGPRWKPGEGKWAGQVDMASEYYGHEIYRFVHDDGREEWYLRNTRDYQLKPLDQATFDAALVAALS